MNNSKNIRTILFVLFILSIFSVFKQLIYIDNLKHQIEIKETENIRLKNNYYASQDSLKTYITKNNNLRSEISGYTLTLEELNGKYSNLFNKYKHEKNKPPKTIIEYDIKIKEIIKEIPVYIESDSIGNKKLILNDSIKYSEGNNRILIGSISFRIKYNKKNDSIISADIIPGKGIFELKQNISLITGLSIDKDSKKPLIWIETKYPNIKFSSIKGAYIMDDPISRKSAYHLRKEFGIGFNIGYGIMLAENQYNKGLYFGIGVSYIPKWLQFGK